MELKYHAVNGVMIMNQEQMLGLLRDFLKLLGGGLVTNGIVSTPNWTTWSGFIIMLAPIGWSLYEKTKTRMIAKVDALPEVAAVITRDTKDGRELANAVPSPTVVPAGTVAAATVAK